MATSPRRPNNWVWEAQLAQLSLAGVRFIEQASHSATNGVSTTYTVQDIRTRRVVLIHIGTGNGDIRVAFNEAATATHIPLIPARYFSVDAKKNDTIRFFNTTGAPIVVNILEIA